MVFACFFLLLVAIEAQVGGKNIHMINPHASNSLSQTLLSPHVNEGDQGTSSSMEGDNGNRDSPERSSTTSTPTLAPTKETGLPGPILTIGHAGTSVAGCSSTTSCSPLVYRGGAVLNTPVFYVMWYGNWNITDQNLVQYFLEHLGNVPPYNLLSSYPFSSPSGNAVWGKSVVKNDSNYSTQLSDSDIRSLVINEPAWATKDSNGIYLILTSPDVNATSGFCRTYCGFHTSFNGVRYLWVGNAETQCIGACSAGKGPNGQRGADAMVSILLHEIAESVTDSGFDAYLSDAQYETGDLCAWNFGTTTSLPDGGKYNVQIGAKNFLLQQLVDYRNLNTQQCALVHAPLPPSQQGGDLCINALPIVPGIQTAQTTYGLATVASPPMTYQSCVNVVNDMFYELTVPTFPVLCTVDTCQGDFDSVIGIYADCGATTKIACNDDACGAQSNVTFTAVQSTYIIGVGNYAGHSVPGTFNLRVSCSPIYSSTPTAVPTATAVPARKPSPSPTKQPSRPTKAPKSVPTFRAP
jgi:hypothetical protein